MHILRSMCSAFLMYSKIPVPQVEWKEENKRYAFCFFPLIGVVIGAVFLLWCHVCGRWHAGKVLFAVGGMLIPLVITGGIHLDGFLDVSDARSSYGTREKLLEIMSDSHIGAFAVIHLAALLLVQLGCLTEVHTREQMFLIAIGFVASRALSGLAAVTFRGAKKDGTLQSFARPAYKNVTVAVLGTVALACAAGACIVNWRMGLVSIATGAGTFLYYRIFSYRRFGGITGDLAGYFLQIFETMILVAAVVGGKLAGG